jgi:hypothetical protein
MLTLPTRAEASVLAVETISSPWHLPHTATAVRPSAARDQRPTRSTPTAIVAATQTSTSSDLSPTLRAESGTTSQRRSNATTPSLSRRWADRLDRKSLAYDRNHSASTKPSPPQGTLFPLESYLILFKIIPHWLEQFVQCQTRVIPTCLMRHEL